LTATPRLRTDRLDLQPLLPEHAIEMAGVLAEASLYAFTGGRPPDEADLEARYRRWIAGAPRAGESWHNWVIRLGPDGLAIGHLPATVNDEGATADIAWTIGTAWQGRGYASEAARALVSWLEGQRTGTITAHVHPANAASARVAANAGLAPTEEVVDGEVVWRRGVPPRRGRA
jgi:RimJ/RimL family protein N-acetyltransferase